MSNTEKVLTNKTEAAMDEKRIERIKIMKDIPHFYWRYMDANRQTVADAYNYNPIVPAVVAYTAALLKENGPDGDPVAVLEEHLGKINPKLVRKAKEILGVNNGFAVVTETARHYEAEALKDFVLNYDYDYSGMNFYKSDTNHSTPACLTELAARILAPEKGDDVADLCCGWGCFLVETAKRGISGRYYAFDISDDALLLSAMRLSVADVKAYVKQEDVLAYTPEFKCDKAFIQAPFGMRIGRAEYRDLLLKDAATTSFSLNKASSADWLFATKLCHVLKPEGTGIALMANGPTFNYNDRDAREAFLKKGMVKAIIALPEKLFAFTGIKSSMVVFGHNEGPVRMVDATDLFESERRWNVMTESNIDEVLSRLAEDGERSKLVSADEIAKNGYSFLPTAYFKEDVAMENPKPIKELVVAIERGIPIKASDLDELEVEDGEETGLAYIGVSDVEDGRIGSVSKQVKSLDSKYQRAFLKTGDVVLTKIGDKPRAAVAEVPEGQTILVTGNLYILRFDTSKIDPYYVAAFFASDDGKRVLVDKGRGSVMHTLALQDLREVQVPLISMERQQKIATRSS